MKIYGTETETTLELHFPSYSQPVENQIIRLGELFIDFASLETVLFPYIVVFTIKSYIHIYLYSAVHP